MKRNIKRLGYSLGGALAFIFGFLVWASWPVKIEGNWSGYATKCMCESYNFLQFKDGKLSQYSNVHSTDFNIGEYRRLEGGLYLVKIYEVERRSFVIGKENTIDPEKSWEVVPRRLFLRHPLFEDISKPLIPLCDYLFRVPRWKDAEDIIATAPARDAKNERRRMKYEGSRNDKKGDEIR